MEKNNINRVSITEEAFILLRDLRKEFGNLMFHQSGGCCDGSAPMCYPEGEFLVGKTDVLLGFVDNVPFYMGGDQFEYWKHTHLTIDIVKGRGASFSLEAPRGVRFLIRSRLLEESDYL